VSLKPVTAHRAALHSWWATTTLAAAAAALSACGGSDGDSSGTTVAVTAATDAFTLDHGQSAQLLANDRIGSAAASTGSGGNAVFTLTTVTVPAGFAITAAGVVTISGPAAPGVFNLAYQLCEAASPTNCANGSAQITVPAPPIVAVADTFNLTLGGSGDTLANDTLRGAAATAATVTASATGTLPTGVTLSAAGLLSVGNSASPGTSTIGYRICQTVALANCATADITLTIPVLGTLSGRAIDAATGSGVPNVTVSAGGLVATTDSTGAFSIAGLTATPRLTVLFNATTHAEAAGITRIGGAATSELQVRMLRVATTATVAVASGGTVTVAGSPAQVVLPADGLQRADGSIPTGNVTVRLTPIDPASDSAVMPGDFTTLVGGTPTSIESFGALNVGLADAAGAALNLRSGQSATVRIPVATRSATVPATIPLFFFDTTIGRWVQEGTATLAGTGAGRYYQGTVTHFSTWNADQVMDSVRVTGCVADANGARVANAFVASDGIDYSGTSSATSNGTGDFTIAIRRSSLATLVALSGGTLSNTLSAGPYTADTTLPACLVLNQAAAGVTMKLTWGAAPSDLDSHLFTPSGSHVYFGNDGNLVAEPFAALDVDDTSSFGPEVITLTRLMVGTYKYYVHNYSGFGAGAIGASSARVELNIPGRNAELFTPPATGETSSTEIWTLFELDVDAQCNVTVRRVPGYANAEPAPPATTAPVYCARP
jgi:hypothetical protein